jgi:hypothetical protein
VTIEDRLNERLNERLNQRDWTPNPGDRLIGKITEIFQLDTRYGPYPMLVVRDDKDEALVAVHCLRGGLLHPVVRKRPSVGDRIGICYLGMSDDGKAHSYAVVWEDDAETAPDWDRIATEQRERSKDDKPAATGSVYAAWPTSGEPPF